ncbi:hypothetical protein C8R45DRAFT_1110527 [Mycena sanguinolenta]|nr:hypothetical protein C8R45DRAFT_1110527 [Mycena sanguinolenta]
MALGPPFKFPSSAPTLEHLYFGGLTHHVILPALPSLRTIAFRVRFDNGSPGFWTSFHPWSGQARCSPLSPTLSPAYFPPIPNRFLLPLRRILSGTRSRPWPLAAHPVHPVIRYLLDFHPMLEEESACARIFADFSTSIQSGMPKTHEQGDIIVETYDRAAR